VSESTDAVVGVYESMKDAEWAVHTLLERGRGQDRRQERGVGGLFGMLTGAAWLFVPSVGALVVLGPLAAGAVAAAEGTTVGSGIGAVLGHFIAKKHVPKYSEHLAAGNYLVLRHQPQASDAQILEQDTTPVEVEHHDGLVIVSDAGAH
jgi:hypothetical protein